MGAEHLQLITAIPWDVRGGSGCYVGTNTLTQTLRRMGVAVTLVQPTIKTPLFTTTRWLFNESLRWRTFDGAATIGVDADGYAISRGNQAPPHIACIKGVMADAARFESGATRASLNFQAGLEKRHARRADLVVTTSRYCAQTLEEMYGVTGALVVPELIDLDAWRRYLGANPAVSDPRKFTILSTCRFYPRKRLQVLLRAAAQLRTAIPELEIRIVGNGPQRRMLHALSRELGLDSVVRWLGDVSRSGLAEEYNRCDIFCLPSAQEGFGIVFLEAMASGKAIVAARAAAAPEVVRNGMLVDPDSPEALAAGIHHLYSNPDARCAMAMAAARDVERYDAARVAGEFAGAISRVVPALRRAPAPVVVTSA